MATDYTRNNLHPDDLACLRRSGLSDETITKEGIVSWSRDQISDRLGVSVPSDGYFIPYEDQLDQTGQPYGRVRLRYPSGGQRYAGGKGDDPQLYIPRGIEELATYNMLVITEGEKKAAKAVQEGIPCVAVQGVWSWPDACARAMDKREKIPVSEDTEPLPSLLERARAYDHVLILGDSDLLTNPQAAAGFAMLAKALRRLKVAAFTSFCPPATAVQDPNSHSGTEIVKQGLDDWLQRDGTRSVAKMLPMLFRAARLEHEGVTEASLARAFAIQYRHCLAYSAGRQWMVWNGSHWSSDDGYNRRTLLIEDFAAAMQRDMDVFTSMQSRICANLPNAKGVNLPEAVSRWIAPLKKAGSHLQAGTTILGKSHGIKAVLELAQPHLNVPDDRWDRDPFLLGVQNGAIDLRTGTLQPPDPSHYITRCTKTKHDAAGECPTWLGFLARVQPDQDDRRALQTLAGYSCTGLTSEQAAFFHYGAGANGKSTFLRTLSTLLGSYAVTAGPALVDRKADTREQAYEMARLPGARLVTVSETENDTDLAVALVKRLTGGEEVSARHMYGKPFTFDPACKLHLATNHLPHVRDTSHGAWRRLRTVAWSETILYEERDDRLMQKLEEELPGILNWIVEGAQAFLAAGLTETPSWRALASEMRGSCSDVERWFRTAVVTRDGSRSQSSLLYEAYCTWAAENDLNPQSRKSWATELSRLGCTKLKNSDGNMVWTNVQLLEQGSVSGKAALPNFGVRHRSQDVAPILLSGGSRRV